eukprot:GCRY01002816.1.p1 GENE.GCRY01002816.1~~GCRY01002816.1.p1  ORF type:complete len:651 (-),score=19.77 GCRY01002816.1:224-2116(-)
MDTSLCFRLLACIVSFSIRLITHAVYLFVYSFRSIFYLMEIEEVPFLVPRVVNAPDTFGDATKGRLIGQINQSWNKVATVETEGDVFSYDCCDNSTWHKKTASIFRCSFSRKTGYCCKAQLKMVTSSDENGCFFQLYRNQHPHNHEFHNSTQLPQSIKDRLIQMQEDYLTPAKMREKLQDDGFEVNDRRMSQIRNFLAYFRRNCGGNMELLSGIHSWIVEHSYSPNIDDDCAFVLHHQLGDGTENRPLLIVLSTKRLLEIPVLQATYGVSPFVAIDATYKLVWNGFPFLVLGTHDVKGHFRAIATAISSNEKEESFVAFLNAVKNAIFEFHSFNWEAQVAISDAASSIRNALKRVFSNIRIGMCWFHVCQNVKERLKTLLPDEATRQVVKSNIYLLHCCHTKEEFEQGCRIVLAHWRSQGFFEFANYFERQWVVAHSEWYCGFLKGFSSTNCATERRNRDIKENYTRRTKLHFSQFFPMLERMLRNWSRDDYTNFVKELPFDLAMETAACILGQSRRLYKSNGELFFLAENSVLSEDVRAFLSLSVHDLSTFSDFQKYISLFRKIRCDSEGRPLECSCVQFHEKMVCKHILAALFLLHHREPHPNAWVFPMNQRRKRGRPKHVGGALALD